MRQLSISQSITKRDSHSLEKYLSEIAKIDMIGPDEETRLAIAIRSGDREALDRLTSANLRFVVSVAKQYQSKGLSLSDLINEGNIGLMKAALRFDETRGFKFISFAVWWIRQAIMMALAEKGRMVRIPLNKINLGNKAQRMYAELEQEHERNPSQEELAEALEINPDDLSSLMFHGQSHLSLDSPNPVTEDCPVDHLSDTNTATRSDIYERRQSLSKEVMRCMSTLTKREKEILCCFYGIGLDDKISLNEIALRLNLSDERVRQIKDKALLTLRKPETARLLRQFMGA